MNSDENKRQEYFRRIRRLKRILRPLPRRATIHRYPVLKWFAAAARRRSALWSFRREHVVPAIYVGAILALLPPPTPQMPLTFLLALLMGCNLMVAAALTFITNPLTIAPLYYADYKIGGFILDTFWHPSLMEEVPQEVVEMISGESGTEAAITTSWMQKFLHGWTQTAIGGLVLGLAFAIGIHLLYLLIIRYYNRSSKAHPFGLLGRLKRHHQSETAAATPAAEAGAETDAATAADTGTASVITTPDNPQETGQTEALGQAVQAERSESQSQTLQSEQTPQPEQTRQTAQSAPKDSNM